MPRLYQNSSTISNSDSSENSTQGGLSIQEWDSLHQRKVVIKEDEESNCGEQG